MPASFSGSAVAPAPEPRCHIDLPPDFAVIRTQSSAWYEDVEAFVDSVSARSAAVAAIRDELHGYLDAAVYEARAAGAVVLAVRVGLDKGGQQQIATLVVSMLNSAPYPAALDVVRLSLEGVDPDCIEEFDTPSGEALMCTEVSSIDEELLLAAGYEGFWQARAYLPVPETPWTVLAQVQVTGRRLRSRDLAQSVAARIVHSFELRDG